MQEYLKEYYRLRDDIDNRVKELTQLHNEHLLCKKGCDSCCEAINVFPIEYFAIKNELKSTDINYSKRRFNNLRKSCVFLKDGICSIYASRPIICRTQGMPLMYQSLSGSGYEVSHCQLNFKAFNLAEFTLDNSVFMPDYNSRLFLLNQKFVVEKEIVGGNFKKRIPLYKVKSE